MYRCEIKLDIEKNSLINFFKHIKKFGVKKIYNERYISSYYLDNSNFDMYNESEEGILPRKKIRVRCYPKSKNLNYKLDYFLETKISDYCGRKKDVISIDYFDKIQKLGIFDKKYGKCRIVSSILYRRKYFLLKNFRITVDDMIQFKYKTKNFKLNNVLVEIKFDPKYLNEFSNYFPFRTRRYSKYCESINYVYKNIL